MINMLRKGIKFSIQRVILKVDTMVDVLITLENSNR